MSDERVETMRAHGVTRCPSWCIQPGDEEETETHQGQLVEYTTGEGQVIYLQVITSWWSDDEDQVVITTALDRYGQLCLSMQDWERISSLGDQIVAAYVNGGEKWAYDGAEEDEG